MITLSSRQADQTPLIQKLEQNQDFLQAMRQKIDPVRLKDLTEWVAATYQVGESDAETAIQHFLRPRLAQRDQIFIPPTTDNPKGKVLPAIHEDGPKDAEVKIDAVPPESTEEKQEVVQEAVEEDPGKNRQQKLVDSIAGLKVTVNEIAEGMFQMKLTQDALGTIAEKVIDLIGQESGKQTSEVVKTLISPVAP